MNAPNFSPALRDELGKLDREQLLQLLGEIVEPSIHTPFDAYAQSEDFMDELEPITAAYRAAYARLAWQEETDAERRANEADWRRDDLESYLAPVTRISDTQVAV